MNESLQNKTDPQDNNQPSAAQENQPEMRQYIKMTKGEKIFDVIIMFIVMLTGGAFGAYTGFVYGSPIGVVYSVEETYVWLGAAAGLFSAYPLAKLYLRKMSQALNKDASKAGVWLFGTFFAGLCGIICTIVVHVAMLIMAISSGGEDFFVFPIALSIGMFIGGIVGVLVGSVFSLAYVLTIEHKQNELTVAETN